MSDDPLTPETLLAAYANGYFPMALEKDDPELYWFSPEERGVLPLDSFNIPRGLARAMKKHEYIITVDTAFEQVIRACGTLTKERHETWINEQIVALYTALFAVGHAHSIEVWQAVAASAVVPPPLRARSGNNQHIDADYSSPRLGGGVSTMELQSPRPPIPTFPRKGGRLS